MKSKEINQNKNKQKNPFPILYETENDTLSRSNTRTDILGTSQSRLSKLSKSLLLTKRISAEMPTHHDHHDKFATLKFGNNKELLFNTDCQVKHCWVIKLFVYLMIKITNKLIKIRYKVCLVFSMRNVQMI